MNKSEPLTLSVDELALAVVMAGQADVAKGILQGSLGEISEEEVRGRLLAAGDALLSRGLTEFRGEDKKIYLSEQMMDIAVVLATPEFSLRLDRYETEKEEATNFHFADGKIVEHKLQGTPLVHQIGAINQEGILSVAISMYGLEDAEEFECDQSVIEYSQLEKAKEIAVTDPKSLDKFLSEAGMSERDAGLLARDILNTVFRGAIMRLDYSEEGVVSNHGLLILGSAERIWFLPITSEGGKTLVRLIPGSGDGMQQELAGLY